MAAQQHYLLVDAVGEQITFLLDGVTDVTFSANVDLPSPESAVGGLGARIEIFADKVEFTDAGRAVYQRNAAGLKGP